MSKIQVNEIVNHFDNGAPDCPKGLTVTGFTTFTGSVSVGGTLTYEDVSNIDSVGIITARQGVHYGEVGSGVTITAVGAGVSLGFLINDSERVRIDNSGRLLVGATSTTAETLVVIQGNSSFTEGDGMLHLSRGSEPTTSVAGAEIGQIKFAAEVNDEAVIIKGERDGGTWTSGSSHPGRLLFSTTADGASSPTFRMIIKSDGKVGINTDVPPAILTTRAGGFDPTDNTVFDGVGLFLSSNVAAGDGNYGSALAWNRPGSDANFKTAIAPVQEGADVDLQGLAFFTANGTFTSSDPLERMRIDNFGRLLINTTEHTSSGPGARLEVRSTDSSDMRTLTLSHSSDDHKLHMGSLSSGTYYLSWGGYYDNGWNSEDADHTYRIGAINFATTTGDGSTIAFRTNDTANSSPIERFTISSVGKLTAPGVYSGTTTGGTQVNVESDGDLLRFTSSRKYKTDIETVEDARADAILNCRPVWYRSTCANDIKEEGATKSTWGWYGFIAEEVAEIEPRLVDWATKDAVVQEDGTVVSVERDPADYEAEGVRYNTFVPLLVNLIKRQKEQIEALEARVAVLEGA